MGNFTAHHWPFAELLRWTEASAMKLTQAEKKLLFVVGFLLLMLIYGNWIGSMITKAQLPRDEPVRIDKMVAASRQLAGAKAVICNGGNFYWKREIVTADACAVAAFKARKPFVLSYLIAKRGDVRETIIVGATDGRYYLFSREWPQEGYPIWSRELCKKPVVITFDGRQRLECHDLVDRKWFSQNGQPFSMPSP